MAGLSSDGRKTRPRFDPTPVGVLLAGGRGRRLGGDPLRLQLAGRPLAHYALESLCVALDEVVVACRLDTELPPLPGVKEAWVEPEGPRGPLAGICSALREANGRAIVACAVSLPLVTPGLLRALATTAPPSGAPALVPRSAGHAHPLVARWEPAALDTLAGLPTDMKLGAVLDALEPDYLDVDDDECLIQVRAPEDLLRAGAVLDKRRRRTRTLV